MVRTVPTADLQHTLDEMESTLDLAVERCKHCGAVNLMPGFERVVAFVCDICGKSNEVAEGSHRYELARSIRCVFDLLRSKVRIALQQFMVSQ